MKQLQSGKLSRNNTCNIEIKITVHDPKGQLDIDLDLSGKMILGKSFPIKIYKDYKLWRPFTLSD